MRTADTVPDTCSFLRAFAPRGNDERCVASESHGPPARVSAVAAARRIPAMAKAGKAGALKAKNKAAGNGRRLGVLHVQGFSCYGFLIGNWRNIVRKGIATVFGVIQHTTGHVRCTQAMQYGLTFLSFRSCPGPRFSARDWTARGRPRTKRTSPRPRARAGAPSSAAMRARTRTALRAKARRTCGQANSSNRPEKSAMEGAR